MAKVEAKPEVAKTPELPRGLRLDEKLMKPGKYEVIPENTFKIDVNLMLKGNRWVVVDGTGRGVECNEVIFRMWSYDEMIELKKMATTFDPTKRLHMVDNDLLNRLKVQKLLVSWTLDRDNPRLRVAHVNGVLTDESWVAFTKLQPNIVTYILDEMNRVYEYNG